MAVQAQYPSNILLLNRNGQAGHDHSLELQPGGFLDQSHMLFNNGVTASNNSRKRGREFPIQTSIGISTPINCFSLQQQQQSNPPLFVDLSHLHPHQPNVVSTGLRLSSGDQQQYQTQQLQQQQQQTNLVCQSSTFETLLSEDFTSQIKQQRDEIRQFLQAQGEQLRRTLDEKRRRHYRILLGAAEESVARKLREKEVEVEKATRRHAELEARAAQLNVEAQVWQAKARAQEATAASLQAQLQQVIMSGSITSAQDKRGGGAGDGLDYSLGGEGQAEDAESGYIDPDRVLGPNPNCKACRNRVASVLLLPCRHLCLCTECDQVATACPLCFATRDSSVEVYLS